MATNLKLVPGAVVSPAGLLQQRTARLETLQGEIQKIEAAYPTFAEAPPEYVARHSLLSAEAADLQNKIERAGARNASN